MTALIRHYLDFDLYNELCKCCLQHTISLYRGTNGLAKSLGYLMISMGLFLPKKKSIRCNLSMALEVSFGDERYLVGALSS